MDDSCRNELGGEITSHSIGLVRVAQELSDLLLMACYFALEIMKIVNPCKIAKFVYPLKMTPYTTTN